MAVVSVFAFALSQQGCDSSSTEEPPIDATTAVTTEPTGTVSEGAGLEVFFFVVTAPGLGPHGERASSAVAAIQDVDIDALFWHEQRIALTDEAARALRDVPGGLPTMNAFVAFGGERVSSCLGIVLAPGEAPPEGSGDGVAFFFSADYGTLWLRGSEPARAILCGIDEDSAVAEAIRDHFADTGRLR